MVCDDYDHTYIHKKKVVPVTTGAAFSGIIMDHFMLASSFSDPLDGSMVCSGHDV